MGFSYITSGNYNKQDFKSNYRIIKQVADNDVEVIAFENKFYAIYYILLEIYSSTDVSMELNTTIGMSLKKPDPVFGRYNLFKFNLRKSYSDINKSFDVDNVDVSGEIDYEGYTPAMRARGMSPHYIPPEHHVIIQRERYNRDSRHPRRTTVSSPRHVTIPSSVHPRRVTASTPRRATMPSSVHPRERYSSPRKSSHIYVDPDYTASDRAANRERTLSIVDGEEIPPGYVLME